MHQNDLFTLQSMATLGGSATATWLICNSLQRAADFNPKWLALVIALIISFIFTFWASEENKFTSINVVLAIVNGCLIYCTSIGLNVITGANENKGNKSDSDVFGAGVSPAPPRKRRFRSLWFR